MTAGVVLTRQCNAIAASVSQDPRLKGIPIALIFQILMWVIPMIIKCMKERNAKELQSRLSGEYHSNANKYSDDTVRRVVKLVKWASLTELHPIGTDKAEVIAIAALDRARTEPEAEIATMINEIEMPMAAIAP